MFAANSSNHGVSGLPRTRAPLGFKQPHAITSYAAESEIYAQGESARCLYRIEFGAVRVLRLLADGRRQIVAFHLAGDTFGFEADQTHCFFAEAMVHTAIRTIEGSVDTPELMALALRSMIRAQEHLLVIGRQSAIEKLAVFLVDLAERQGDLGQIDLPMTRLDIGDYLGMTIETVSRTLSKMRDAGILRLQSARSIEILKPEKLRRLCQ
jgi:CRP/FNR family nitrogen fixation transcriptional regulator